MMRQFLTCGLVLTLLLGISLASYGDEEAETEPDAEALTEDAAGGAGASAGCDSS